MPTEAPMTSSGCLLAPRAAIAQLTLTLRSSLQEFETAEAEHATIDQNAAVAQLRARLEPLLEVRRRTLDEALARAEVEAAAEVDAARLEAASIVAAGSSNRLPEPVEVMTTTVDDDHVISVYDGMAPSESSAVELYQPPAQGIPTINIVIDAEAFARVIASVLGEHLSAGRESIPATPVVPQPTLEHARHLDVLLVAIATVIVLVILAAWIG